MSEFLFLSSDFNLFFSIHEINVVIYICYSNILADFKKGYTHFLSVKLRTRRNYLIFFYRWTQIYFCNTVPYKTIFKYWKITITSSLRNLLVKFYQLQLFRKMIKNWKSTFKVGLHSLLNNLIKLFERIFRNKNSKKKKKKKIVILIYLLIKTCSPLCIPIP